MSTVTGKVSEINEMSGNYGTFYTVTINNDRYNAGNYPPKYVVGDYITASYSVNGRYKKLDHKSVRKVDPGSVPETPATSAPASTVGGAAFSSRHSDNNQRVIARQAARNTAIAFMGILKDTDSLPVAKSSKPADRYEALRGILERLTTEFFSFSVGESPTPLTDKSSVVQAAASPAVNTGAGDPWEDDPSDV